jgi:hypothetical protein
MSIKGCGCIQNITIGNNEIKDSFLRSLLSKKDYKKIGILRARLFEISILDYLYTKFSIFAFHSPGKLVISPSLIIKKKEIKYFFNALSETLKLGREKLIKIYLTKNIKSIRRL